MAKIVQKISLEVAKPNYLQAIIAKQFDSDSRYLQVTLVNGSEKIEVQESSTVTINARRIDGAEDAFRGEVNEGGTVTVPLTYWMLELEGKLECDITVIDTDNRKLSTTKFTVEVERASCTGEGTDSAEKYDIIILQGKDIVSSVNGKKGEVHLLASDVGAAPTGYGLGETTTKYFPASENELENILDAIIESMPIGATGFYRILDNEGTIWEGGTMIATVHKLDDAYVTVDFSGYIHNTKRLCKTKNGGNWHSLEWVNPPLTTGVEYRTTERFMGYPVYAQLVNCGTQRADKNTDVPIGVQTRVVRFNGYVGYNGQYDYTVQTQDIWVGTLEDPTTIKIKMGAGTETREGTKTYVAIYYTKPY